MSMIKGLYKFMLTKGVLQINLNIMKEYFAENS